jgi:predicted N-formylglutamate amidohydrolase
MGLLDLGDSQPVIAERIGCDSRFLLICDHAGRAVPQKLHRMGVAEAGFDLHIAWDIGAAAVTRRLSAGLEAPCILQRYSRLVIDCNRDPSRPDAIPQVSDGVVIPANQGLTEQDRTARIEAIHTPYHAAITAELDRRQTLGLPTLLVFMHSFTPRMAGVDRPWSFGVIREPGSRFSRAVLDDLCALGGFEVGDNEPYAMDGSDFSAPTHALARGLDYLELEMRQDLIADEAGQAAIADLLKGVLTRTAVGL